MRSRPESACLQGEPWRVAAAMEPVDLPGRAADNRMCSSEWLRAAGRSRRSPDGTPHSVSQLAGERSWVSR